MTKAKITSTEFVRLWNLLSKQCEIKVKAESMLPCSLLVLERSACELSHVELVAERLNKDEDFFDYMEKRIGCGVQFEISSWGDGLEVKVRKHINN